MFAFLFVNDQMSLYWARNHHDQTHGEWSWQGRVKGQRGPDPRDRVAICDRRVRLSSENHGTVMALKADILI